MYGLGEGDYFYSTFRNQFIDRMNGNHLKVFQLIFVNICFKSGIINKKLGH